MMVTSSDFNDNQNTFKDKVWFFTTGLVVTSYALPIVLMRVQAPFTPHLPHFTTSTPILFSS